MSTFSKQGHTDEDQSTETRQILRMNMYLYVRNHALHCNLKLNFTVISV